MTNRLKDRQKYNQTHRENDQQIDRQTDRQIDDRETSKKTAKGFVVNLPNRHYIFKYLSVEHYLISDNVKSPLFHSSKLNLKKVEIKERLSFFPKSLLFET